MVIEEATESPIIKKKMVNILTIARMLYINEEVICIFRLIVPPFIFDISCIRFASILH